MNGALEKRLDDHIDAAVDDARENGEFRGEFRAFITNFNERVLPSLVTSNGCDARHSALKTDLADDELSIRRATCRIWSNRAWSAALAVVLLLLGTWYGATKGSDANATADEAGDVSGHSVAVPR